MFTDPRSALFAFAALVAAAPLPAEEHPLAKVVDGDTVHVRRNGELEKLRLLCVDTEEVTRVSVAGKPSTALGDAASAAVKRLLGCGPDGLPLDSRAPASIRLESDSGVEERGNYGRLLCYAFLGEQNLNLFLVERGFSPYFTKYGYSRRYHAEFLAAEREAQRLGLGIWSQDRAPDEGRDYEPLRRWWDLRADAQQAFRKRLDSGANLLPAHGADLARHAGETATVFAAVSSLTIGRTHLVLSLEGNRRLEAILPLDAVPPALVGALARRCREGSPNFLYIRGKIERTRQGAAIHPSGAADIAFDSPPR